MVFRQLFEPVSSTYTYLIGSESTREAVLVDPVMPAWQRDLEVVRSLDFRLAYTVETHVHDSLQEYCREMSRSLQG